MRRSESAMARRVDDELVILDVTTGRYYGLSDVGAVIWACLSTECSQAELIAAVLDEYDVDEEQASRDVAELLEHLIDTGLVVG